MAKRKTRDEILAYIELIRDSADRMVDIFTFGSCYRFYKILKCFEPRAEAFYDHNHVITKIGNDYFDITGLFEFYSSSFIPLDDKEVISRLEKCKYKEP